MELQLGVFGIFPNSHENKRKQNAPTIFVRHVAFHACLSSHSNHSTYSPDESQLSLIAGKKPEYPQLEPHVRVKMVQVLWSPVYICGLNLVWVTIIWRKMWSDYYKKEAGTLGWVGIDKTSVIIGKETLLSNNEALQQVKP